MFDWFATKTEEAPVAASNNINSTVLINKINDLHKTHLEHKNNVSTYFFICVIIIVLKIMMCIAYKVIKKLIIKKAEKLTNNAIRELTKQEA